MVKQVPNRVEKTPPGQLGKDIEMLSVVVAVRDALSVTNTLKLEDPDALGVPPIVAPDRPNPAGRDPEMIDQLYGAVPPPAIKACE